jgi:mono/diheme cytochrome c family protein
VRSPSRKLFSLVAVGAAMAFIAGCDTNENANTERGRELFVENCGTCHILAQAATTNETGPDLDASFAAAREAGMDNDTIEGVVQAQIGNPRTTDPEDPTYMPAEIVTGQDAEDVATYVASVAGVPGIEPPIAPGGPGGQVFANNGCGACHTFAAAESTGQVGPALDDVIPGQDAAMVEQSIVEPDAEISEGFDAGIMPAYADLTDEDLELLVSFLIDEAGGGSAGGGNG